MMTLKLGLVDIENLSIYFDIKKAIDISYYIDIFIIKLIYRYSRHIDTSI